MMAAALLAAILPFQEMTVIRQVAGEYGLDKERTALLVAIRKFENGRPGKEFGVERAAAMRFTDGINSFRLQARWAAGTIKRRYNGNLAAFACRYCPVNATAWERGVRQIMKKAMKEVR